MTKGLNEIQVKILTWVVYALILFLTTVTGWQQVKITNLPDDYVRLERYKSDSSKCDQTLIRIETKLDRVIMRIP